MKQFGLIGTDIAASASPALFKAAYKGKWGYDLLDGKDFDSLYNRFLKDYDAVNVTAPFKEQALAKADEASEEALLCGSANILIKNGKGKVMADNSDFEGVTLSLLSAYAVQGVDVDDEDAFGDFLAEKTALVIGCGGAGKAAAAACLTLGFGKTVVADRTVPKAEAFVKHLKEFYGDVCDDELESAGLENVRELAQNSDLVIYAISCPIPVQWTFNDGQTVLEANYQSPALEKYKDSCNYICGLNWLFNQAVVAYEAFTGEEPDEDAMKNNLNQ